MFRDFASLAHDFQQVMTASSSFSMARALL